MKSDSVMYFIGTLLSITMGALGIFHYLWIKNRADTNQVSVEKLNQMKESSTAQDYENNKKAS